MGTESSAYDHCPFAFLRHLTGIFRKEKSLRCDDPAESRYADETAVKMARQDQVGAPLKVSVHIGRIVRQEDLELILELRKIF